MAKIRKGWEDAESRVAEVAKKNSVFVRLEDDGDKVVGAFVDDPRVREVHWTGVEYVDCTGDECKHCAAGVRVGTKVMLNFFVASDKTMRVVEGGPAFFKSALKVVRKYGQEAWWFEIERQGAKGDTKTTYTILPESSISETELAEIRAAKIHDLWELGSNDFPSDAKRGDGEPAAKPREEAPARAPREPAQKPRERAITPPPAEPAAKPAPRATAAAPADDFFA